jgi:2-C-methyl-D-erythritol 4-phosphate cytidylyltransferase
MPVSRHFALIPAAGVGARMDAGRPKQYLPLAGKPMLLHVLETFAVSDKIAHVYLVVSAEDEYIHQMLLEAPQLENRMTVLRNGGKTRQESVLNGLKAIREQLSEEDWVLVHDAARPGLTQDLIDKLVLVLAADPVGGLLAMPVVDTLKRSTSDGRSMGTVSREGIWAAQTPQMFRYGLLCQALGKAIEVTDEAGAIEAIGLNPKLVEGSVRNFKITLPGDIALAERYLKDSG